MLQRSFCSRGVRALLMLILLCCTAQMAVSQKPASDVWKDSATGLTWAAKDNGTSVSLGGAREYCTGLRTGGFSDWRLPTIDELMNLYDKSSKKAYRVKGPVELGDACVLSGSTNDSGEVWSFCFNYGGKTLVRASGHGSAGRALCVR